MWLFEISGFSRGGGRRGQLDVEGGEKLGKGGGPI